MLKKRESSKKFSETKQAIIKELNESQRALFEKLRQKRARLAEEKGVPSFVIAHDQLLIELTRTMPTTEEELLKMKGIGNKKLNWIKELLLIIQQHKKN